MLGNRSLRAIAAGVCALALWVASASAGLAAEAVKTRAWPHPGFARIVFDWPAPITFDADVTDGRLTVAFPRALETSFAQVRKHLGAYVSSIDVDAEGRLVTLILAKPVRVRTSTIKQSVIVDLVDRRQSASAAAPKSSASGAEPLKVRVGEHADFTRVVFDWTRDVTYRVDKEGGRVSIDFSRAATAALAPVTRVPPARISGAAQRVEGGHLKIDLDVPEDARVRHFRLGTKVVLDILNGNPSAAKAAPRPGAARSGAATPEATARPAPPAAAAANAPAGAAGPPPPAPVQPSAAAPLATAAPTLLLPTIAGAPAAANGANQSQGAPKTEPGSSLTAVTDTLDVAVSESDRGVRVAFNWSVPTAAAVYRRGGHIWAVFDRAVQANIVPIAEPLSETVFLAEQIAHPDATAVRLRVRPGLYPSVTAADAAWLIDLVPEPVAPSARIEVRREPEAPLGPRVFLPIPDATGRIAVTDPEVGDALYVVPVGSPRGVIADRGFAEFAILATAQGAAIIPRADGIAVRPVRNGVEITGAEGLSLSKAVPAESEGDEEGQPPRSFYRFDDWSRGTRAQFSAMERRLVADAANAPSGVRNIKRWDLARFYLAHGFAADARGVLGVIAAEDPLIAGDPEFRAVRGATLFELRRYDEAAQDLFHTTLDGDPGAALMRGAVAAAREDWPLAMQEFAFGDSGYPLFSTRVQDKIRLLAVTAALAANDVDALDRDLTILVKEPSSRGVESEANLLFAKTRAELGDIEGAIETLDEVIAHAYRPTWAKARFAQTMLRLETGEIDRKEATNQLEGLRFSWRGGGFEFDLIHRLGELYLEQGDYRSGLTAFREIVTNFTDLPETRLIAAKMNETFRRLYLDDEASELPPIGALALYYDFRELTPVGDDGDAMIRNLADRLAAVDLLIQAAELLEHQVKFRLEQEERARVAARLALIYLFYRKPEEALRVLRTTRWRSLPNDLVAQRRQLEARALTGLDRDTEALKLLAKDSSRAAQLIRVDIHWRLRDWAKAARSIDGLLGDRWKGDEPLSDAERQQVVQLAVALTLGGDRTGIDSVRRRFGAKLAGTPEAHTFQLLSDKIDAKSMAFREVSGAVAQLDTLEAFMAGYREIMREGGLSTIN